MGSAHRIRVLRLEILGAHASGATHNAGGDRKVACVTAMVGNGDDLVPPSTCPNCGEELHPDQAVCANCGYIKPSSRASIPASTGISGVGGAFIGCGGAFVAIFLCIILYGFSIGRLWPNAAVLLVEAVLAIGCFLGFRAVIAGNRHAREALIAFVVVFVVIGGGLAACFGMFTNLRP